MRVFVAHLDDLLDWTPRSTRNPVSQTRTPSFLLKRTKRGGKNLHVLWAAKIKSIASKSLREHQQIQDLSGWNMIEIYIYIFICIYIYIYICIYICIYIWWLLPWVLFVQNCPNFDSVCRFYLEDDLHLKQCWMMFLFCSESFFFAENIYIYICICYTPVT